MGSGKDVGRPLATFPTIQRRVWSKFLLEFDRTREKWTKTALIYTREQQEVLTATARVVAQKERLLEFDRTSEKRTQTARICTREQQEVLMATARVVAQKERLLEFDRTSEKRTNTGWTKAGWPLGHSPEAQETPLAVSGLWP